MKASVIIPTYYRSHELSCLLDSLLDQTVKPGEVIVVDDTPNLENSILCEKYAAKFDRTGVSLIYVRNRRERSISIARNLGGKIALGDILIFTDSDVVLHSDYIEKVLSTFKKYPKALGVEGWYGVLVDHQFLGGFRFQIGQIFKKIFILWHFSKNTSNYFELPIELSSLIYSQYLIGQSTSVKKSIFNDFQFDENLKGFSFMEDFLFSASIYKKHPESLLINPEVKYTHTNSAEGRLTGKNMVDVKRRNRKYVLVQLWGSKGLLMFGWQNMGIFLCKAIAKLRVWKYFLSEE